jgi:mono/diheme cytochrome c family protein
VTARAALAAALLLLPCGCGGHRTADPSRGRSVFASACAGCHTLTGHDTRARGGDLAIAPLSAAEVASFARVMPVRLSRADLAAVAAYIHTAETARRNG